MIKKYHKKSAVVEALQWTGDNLRKILWFIELPYVPYDDMGTEVMYTWKELQELVQKEGLVIYILNEPHAVEVGDFVTKDAEGNIQLYKPDAFTMTYEEVGQ